MNPYAQPSELEKCLAGEEFDSSDPELIAMIVKARQLCVEYNQLAADDTAGRNLLLHELLGGEVKGARKRFVASLVFPIVFVTSYLASFSQSDSFQRWTHCFSLPSSTLQHLKTQPDILTRGTLTVTS